MTITSTKDPDERTLRASRPEPAPRLTFRGTVLSEWIKFRSVRSSFALLTAAVLAMVALSAFGALGVVLNAGNDARLVQQGVAQIPSIGLYFGQLVLAALAVLLIASEYSTGMIRTTLAAVPKRTPVLLAKGLMAAVLGAVVGVTGAVAAHFIIQPILATKNLHVDLDAAGAWASFGGAGLYLALVAVLALGIGTLLRNTASAIVTVVGLLFVLPVALSLVPGDIAATVMKYLPSEAGGQLMAPVTAAGDLSQLQGGLVLAAWAAVPFLAGLITLKRRDC